VTDFQIASVVDSRDNLQQNIAKVPTSLKTCHNTIFLDHGPLPSTSPSHSTPVPR